MCAGRDFVFRCIACFPRCKRSSRALCEVSGSVSAEHSGSFGLLGQFRTEQRGERVSAELPPFCRRFAVFFFLAVSVSMFRSGKRIRAPPTLDTLKRSAFCALWEGRDTTRKQNRSQGVLAALASMCENCTHSAREIFSASKAGGAYAPRRKRKALSRAAAEKTGEGSARPGKMDGETKNPAPENGSRAIGFSDHPNTAVAIRFSLWFFMRSSSCT